MPTPSARVRPLNSSHLDPTRAWVLYWMTSFRRTRFNFALEHAVDHARTLNRPLVVLEALRIGYPHASDRLHTFILQGMAENARRFQRTCVEHYAYVEPEAGAGSGLLEALAQRACVVVGDDWPSFFVPRMQQAAAERVAVRFEVVDSNGLFPMRATSRVFTTAHSYRAHLQKELPPHLGEFPAEDPLAGLSLPEASIPKEVERRWPRASKGLLEAAPSAIAHLPVDHSVPPSHLEGGSHVAEARLARFIRDGLPHYLERRNEPELDGTSTLSPALHFGHVSAHEVFRAVANRERWSPTRLSRPLGGTRTGWWGMSAAAEGFLDQLVTWRELAFNASAHDGSRLDSLATLPAFARATLQKHSKDPRPHRYSLEQLERAETHDELWNATQRQLVRDGWFHNYLRMLWGKKILEWSPSPLEALRRMAFLMDRYSLDGRDPVSWSGYLWVLGKYDRAWGPERPIFGSVRYMSSDNTARKISVKQFLERYRA